MNETAFVSTYLPHRCGIATFTQDLSRAVGGGQIVALHPNVDLPSPYPAEVRHRIRRDVASDYLRIARALDQDGIGAVSVQHEYGIWGGRDGAYVLDFVRALRTPVVATLHTVLRQPTASQRRVLTDLVDAAAATVVMSASAAALLARTYGADPARVEVIPHGVPSVPLVAPDSVKPQLGLESRLVVLSFGLLGPGKGFESAIAALPALVRADPTALYVIVGATHPDLVRRDGDAYRRSLESLVASLGVTDHVRFVDRFVEPDELALWLEAADIFVTPYPNLDQIVSGTLSYAMGAGKAIVSTPYAYARERLAGGRGRLVAPGSSEALADAFVELARNRELREVYGRRACEYSRGMRWPMIGAMYRRLFAGLGRAPAAVPTLALRAPAGSLSKLASPRG